MEVNLYTENTPKYYYGQGTAFLEAAYRCFRGGENSLQTDEPIHLEAPIMVNAAFACEMFLKGLLLHEKKNINHIHDLLELYKQLSPDARYILGCICCDHGNDDEKEIEEKFSKYLSRYSKAFSQIRYMVENKGWNKLGITSMLSLAYNIGVCVGQLIEQPFECEEAAR